jgi:hypothetical protein
MSVNRAIGDGYEQKVSKIGIFLSNRAKEWGKESFMFHI